MHKFWDVTGWGCFGVGTAATWQQDHIAAIGLAVAGLIIVVGKATISTYKDYVAVEVERARALATVRHDDLVAQLERVRCPLLESGGCPAAGGAPTPPPVGPATGGVPA